MRNELVKVVALGLCCLACAGCPSNKNTSAPGNGGSDVSNPPPEPKPPKDPVREEISKLQKQRDKLEYQIGVYERAAREWESNAAESDKQDVFRIQAATERANAAMRRDQVRDLESKRDEVNLKIEELQGQL